MKFKKIKKKNKGEMEDGYRNLQAKEGKKRKRSTTKKLHKKLISLNFMKKNKKILYLRLMDAKQLNQVLQKYLPKEITNKFLEELVDGLGFIFFMTEKLGLLNLESYLGFNHQQIHLLMQLYFSIYTFRKNFCRDFHSDEIPVFL